MKYKSVKVAKFRKRPNRFIAHVIVDNKEEIVHVKNTGGAWRSSGGKCGDFGRSKKCEAEDKVLN